MILRDIRKEKHIKAGDMASRIGVSQGHYSKMERGKRRINDELLKKIATILGETEEAVQDAIRMNQVEVLTLKSWLSNIRINGLPFIKAFRYHLQAKGREAATMDETELKTELRQFIENNISYSVLAELSEKRGLIDDLRSKLCAGDVLNKEKETDREQIQGTN